MKVPAKTVFYTIEKTIKSYRRFSKNNFSKVVDDITIDQKLILQYIRDSPNLYQNEIAELVFKDNASLTRMINIMVNKKFVKRSMNVGDRRRFKIEITSKGKEVLKKLEPVIVSNRKKALSGVTENELIELDRILNKILTNVR